MGRLSNVQHFAAPLELCILSKESWFRSFFLEKRFFVMFLSPYEYLLMFLRNAIES